MELIGIENFRLIDRNKAAADTFFNYNNQTVKAEFFFYLQGMDCLSIRVGRHDTAISTKELENYINENRIDLKKQVKPDVVRVREEQRARLVE